MKNLILGDVPDFSKDPRRRTKGLLALDFCYEIDLSQRGIKHISAVELRKHLGNGSSTESSLGPYLHTLVRQVGQYTKNGTPYGYQTVPHRVERLEAILGVHDGFRRYAEAQGKSFAVAPSRDEYKITGDRHYHWWTNMRGELRRKLFLATHGVLFDYDLQTAKPAITLQAWRLWMAEHHPMDLRLFAKCQLPTWSQLVDNRSSFRTALAHQVGITVDEAKAVCQNVLNSAWASPHKDNGICQLIGNEATKRLMANELYRGLQSDFKVMWSYFKRESKDGLTPGQFMSSFYNRHERRVMDAIADELSSRGIEAWYVHDGFMTPEKVDVSLIEAVIKSKTKLNMQLEEEIFEAGREVKQSDKEEMNEMTKITSERELLCSL